MATNNGAFLVEGTNYVNGYTVTVERVIKAHHVSPTNAVAKKHWGTIQSPDGDITTMDGWTTVRIKKYCGVASTPRTNGVLAELKKAKALLESLGMPTTEIDAKIADEQTAIDNAKAEKAYAKRKADLNKAVLLCGKWDINISQYLTEYLT